jgi:hypothetical protein
MDPALSHSYFRAKIPVENLQSIIMWTNVPSARVSSGNVIRRGPEISSPLRSNSQSPNPTPNEPHFWTAYYVTCPVSHKQSCPTSHLSAESLLRSGVHWHATEYLIATDSTEYTVELHMAVKL